MLRFAFIATLLCLFPLSVSAEPTQHPVFDLHCDVLYRMSGKPFDLVDAPEYISVSIGAMESGGVGTQVFALWVDSDKYPEMEGARTVFQMIDLFEQQVAQHNDRIAHATSMSEADAITNSGRIPIFLFIEGAGPMADDLAILRTYDRLGVRGMTLTWMHNLSWAGSSTDEKNPAMGLTEFGRDVVREMNRLGWVVDLSHVSDQTFHDALSITSDPVIISHSGCRALADHPRNVSDDMLRALAENGGVIGIVAFPGYIDHQWEEAWDTAAASIQPEVDKLLEAHGGNASDPEYRHQRRLMIQAAMPSDKRTGLDVYIDHIAHAIEVAGPEHVALGSDFDGIWANVDGLRTSADWPNVETELRNRGYPEEIIHGVMGGNARRVLRQVMDD